MATWQLNGPVGWRFANPLDAPQDWSLVHPLGAVLETADTRIEFTGGFGGSGPVTITGAKVYTIDWNGGSPLYTLLAQTTSPLAVSGLVLSDVVGRLFDGADTIAGSAGADAVDARAGDDSVDGQAGDDTLRGGSGADSLAGGAGNDTLLGLDATGTGADAGNRLDGGSGDDRLVGAAGSDTLLGGDGADTLLGGPGDTLDAGAGDDRLEARGVPADPAITLAGGAGDDTYWVWGAVPVSIGELAGGGIDTVELTNHAAANESDWRPFTLAPEVEHAVLNHLDGSGVSHFAFTGNDAANRITVDGWQPRFDWEDLEFVSDVASETILGLGGNDTIYTEYGNDVLDGGDGDDVLYAQDGTGPDFDAAVDDRIEGGAGNDTLGSWGGNDRLYGGDGNDYLESEGLLSGDAGDDTLVGGDTLDGGTGTDRMYGGTVYRTDTADDVVVESALGGIDTVESTATITLAAYVENLVLLGASPLDGFGNTLANTLTGNAAANGLNGGAGDDTLDGGAGDDTLLGSPGVDQLTGGDGADTFRFLAAAGVANADLVSDFDAASDRIELGAAAFAAAGPPGALDPAAFREGVAALDADDRILYDPTTGQLRYDADGNGAGLAQLFATVAAGSAVTAGHFVVTGASLIGPRVATAPPLPPPPPAPAPATVGTAGNDDLAGGNGNDTLDGLAGDDTIAGNAGSDRLLGGTGNDRLGGGSGQDTILGGAGDDSVVGQWDDPEASGDEQGGFLDGGDGNDTIVGNYQGIDTIVGGAGNDLIDGGGYIYAKDGGDTVQGGDGNDTIRASTSDRVYGGRGDDVIDANFYGTVGLAAGGAGNDVYRVTSAAGSRLVELAGEGTRDEVVLTALRQTTGAPWVLPDGIEHCTLLPGANTGTFTLHGNAGGNLLQVVAVGTTPPASVVLLGLGGNDRLSGNRAKDTLDGGLGNDVLLGGAGDDRLLGQAGNDTLNGDAGADTLAGGTGNDVYFVDSAGDRIVELAGGGFDRVIATVSHQLVTYANELWLGGSAAIHGKGNVFDNTLAGNGAANRLAGEGGNDTLNGGAGADTLVGGLGNDRLVGGKGADRLQFDAPALAAHADVVVGFEPGVDTLAFENAVFTGLGAAGPLAAQAFRMGTAAGDADDRLVYDAASGRLWYDADGSGAGAAVLVATLVAGGVLTAGDLFVT